MPTEFYPPQLLLLTLSGFVNRRQADVIAYLVEENRVFKDQMNGRRASPEGEDPRWNARALPSGCLS